jgi:hypothetical protein
VKAISETHLGILHNWINQSYSRKFWNMPISLAELTKDFLSRKDSTISRSFFICHGKKHIAFFEVYHVTQSELADKFPSTKEDYGIHLLMAPPKDILYLHQRLGNVSLNVLLTIIDMLFSSQTVNRIIAEPDIENNAAQALAVKAGFQYVKDIQLLDKKAKLFILSKVVSN